MQPRTNQQQNQSPKKTTKLLHQEVEEEVEVEDEVEDEDEETGPEVVEETEEEDEDVSPKPSTSYTTPKRVPLKRLTGRGIPPNAPKKAKGMYKYSLWGNNILCLRGPSLSLEIIEDLLVKFFPFIILYLWGNTVFCFRITSYD